MTGTRPRQGSEERALRPPPVKEGSACHGCLSGNVGMFVADVRD